MEISNTALKKAENIYKKILKIKKKRKEKIENNKKSNITLIDYGYDDSNPSSDKGYICGTDDGWMEPPGPVGCDNFPDVFPYS